MVGAPQIKIPQSGGVRGYCEHSGLLANCFTWPQAGRAKSPCEDLLQGQQILVNMV